MKRLTKFISVLMLVLAILNAVSITPAQAAKKKKSAKTVQTQQKSNKPRNLLTEYYSALKRMDSAKAISLINEGINLEDATDATFKALWAKIHHSSNKDYAEALSALYSDGNSLLQSVGTGMMKGLDSLLSKSGGSRRVSASDVNKFSAILSALKDKGARFKAASFYSVIFSPQMPANLFEAIINITGQTVFTGDELGFLIVDMDVKSAVNAGISKLEVLVKRGAKIDRSNSSDGIVAKVIDNVLPYWPSPKHLSSSDVSYLRKVFDLLGKLNVNSGPKERAFWEVLSTKTPWEILNSYREDHRNEPQILHYCNEIESLIP